MTRLPATAPTACARSQLGPNVMKWMRARGWLDHRRCVRACAAYETPQRGVSSVSV